MKPFIFIHIFFAGIFSQADGFVLPTYERCINLRSAEICNYVSNQLTIENPKKALIAANRACDLEPKIQNCGWIYDVAKKAGPEAKEKAFKRLKNLCSKDRSFCQTLVQAYEDKKDFSGALEIGKKYGYEKVIYDYGDKSQAFSIAINKCKANNSKCGTYLYQMPDHPQFEEILRLSESWCKNSVDANCTLEGKIYFKRGDFEAAYNFWSTACKKNDISCLLIIGSDKYSDKKKKAAFEDLCILNGNNERLPSPEREVYHKNCKGFGKNTPIPDKIARWALSHFNTYILTKPIRGAYVITFPD